MSIKASHFLEDLDKAVEASRDEKPRYHLGASIVGKECQRDTSVGIAVRTGFALYRNTG